MVRNEDLRLQIRQRCAKWLIRVIALLPGAMAVYAAAPALGQTTLVSNLDQAVDSRFETGSITVAQGFTTGSNASGFRLSSIEAVINNTPDAAQRATIRVQLWDATTGGQVSPRTKVADLTVPSSIATGTVSFAAPANTILDLNKTYFVVFYTAGSYGMQVSHTASDSEDSGGQTGWSIQDNSWIQSLIVPSTYRAWLVTQSNARIRVKGAAVLAAPTGLSVDPGNAGLSLSWTAPQGTVTGYDVHYTSAARSAVADNAAVQTGAASAGWVAVSRSGVTASQALSSLTNDTLYRVRVRAVYGSGPSDWVTGTGTPTTLPVTGLTVKPIDTGLSLSWTAPAGAQVTSYDVHYTSATVSSASDDAAAQSGAASVGWVAITRSGVTASQTISSLTNDTLYRVRVRARTASVTGAWSHGTGTPVASTAEFTGAITSTVSEGLYSQATVEIDAARFVPLTIGLEYTGVSATAAAGNTCKAGEDFVARPTSVTIAAGDTTATVRIRTCYDREIEERESFTVTLVPGTGYTVGTSSTFTTYINDSTVSVTLTAAPNPVAEGSSVTITATRSGQQAAANIPVTLIAGTAEAGDYSALSSIPIAVGGTSGTATIAANQDADTQNETFVVLLDEGKMPQSHAVGSPSSVQITIDDDEPPLVSLSVSTKRVAEGSGVTVTATLSEVLAAAVTIPLTVTAGTAEAADYSAPSSIAIAADSTSGEATISTVHDSDADHETLTVALGTLPSTVTAGSPSTIGIVIVDYEGRPSVSLSAPDDVTEGSSVTVTATLSEALGTAVTIPLTLGGGAGDTAESGDYGTLENIRIAAGDTLGRGSIQTNQDDDGDQERFTVALGALPPDVKAGSPSSITIKILDDERSTVTLRATSNRVQEGDEAEFTLRFSAPVPPSAFGADILVRVAGSDTEPGYEDVKDGNLLVRAPVGETSATFTVQTYRDTDTDDEHFTVSLRADDQYGFLTWMTIGSPSSVDITIEDDATPQPDPDPDSGSGSGTGTKSVWVTLSADSKRVEEGLSAFITLNFSAPVPYPVWEEIHIPIRVTGIDTEAGDLGRPGLHNIRVGGGTRSRGIFVSTNIDEDTDDERFTVSLGGSLPEGLSAGSPSSLDLVIEDVISYIPPGFSASGGPASFTIEENHAEGAVLGIFAATDEDGDPLSYSLSSADGDHQAFAIGAEGTVRVAEGVTLDFEEQAAWTFTARVSDGGNDAGNTEAASAMDATFEVTVTVENVEEPPAAPTGVTVAAAGPDRLQVRWTAPSDAGALPVADYDVRWFAGATDPEDETDWIEPGEPGGHDHAGTATETTIVGLQPDIAYRAQVRATGDGSGPWSASAGGRTDPVPTVPAFTGGGTATFAVAENHQAQAAVGELAATDEDGDDLTYWLTSGGEDHDAFTIDGAGAIRVAAGVILDYETQTSYTFTARVSDGEDEEGHPETAPASDDTVRVTVTVENVVEKPGVKGALPDLTLVVGAPDVTVDASLVLTGEALTYSFASSDAQVAAVNRDAMTAGGNQGALSAAGNQGATVRLRGASAGAARITVTASNAGGEASVTFAVTVKAVSDEEAAALGQSLDGLARTLFSGATGVIGTRVEASDNGAQSLGNISKTDAWSALAGMAGLPTSVQSLSRPEAWATLTRLVGLPAPVPLAGAPAPGIHGGGVMASPGGMASPGYGIAMSGSGAPGGMAAPGHGIAMSGSAPPGGMTSPGHGHAMSGSGATGRFSGGGHGTAWSNGYGSGHATPTGGGLAFDGLWHRSFAFSIAPGGGQTPEGAPASALAQTSDGGPASGGTSALPRWTVWGTGDVQRFSGGAGETSYDGAWRTAYLGVDRRFGARWLGGVALSRGTGEADYTFGGTAAGSGRLETDLTAVYPYLKGVLAGGAELWATVGAGRGGAMNTRNRQDLIDSEGDLSMRLAAAGLRHALMEWSAVRLSGLADVGAATLEIDGDGSLAGLESTALRARAGVEIAGAGAFSPYLRLNARYDGGGDGSEAGYEAEAGMRRSGDRVDFELRGRWMALSGDDDYRESGATATIRLKSAPGGTGLSGSLTPSWGRPGGTDFVWRQGSMPVVGTLTGAGYGADARPALVWNANLGYGIESRLLRRVLTPMIGYERGALGQDRIRFGAGYDARPKWLPRELKIGLGMLRDQTLGNSTWGMELRAETQW